MAVSRWWQHGWGRCVRASFTCLLEAELVWVSKLYPEYTDLAEMLKVPHLKACEPCQQWLPTKDSPASSTEG